jgi:ketosteroid isomerase-like protein
MMRRFLIVIFSVVAILGMTRYTVTAAVGDADLKDEILKVEEVRNQALQHGDVAALDRLYSDDVVYTNATGAFLTKSQHLADLKARTLNFKSFKHSDVEVHVHGTTGIVSGLSTSAVDYKGTVSSSPRRFLNVYVQENGRWLCVAHFETELPKQ